MPDNFEKVSVSPSSGTIGDGVTLVTVTNKFSSGHVSLVKGVDL